MGFRDVRQQRQLGLQLMRQRDEPAIFKGNEPARCPLQPLKQKLHLQNLFVIDRQLAGDVEPIPLCPA